MMAKAKPKNLGGRPLKFKTVKELEDACGAYFVKCKREELPITITGMALALDTSRETLMNYQKRDKFFDAIKRAKLHCENYAEVQLFKGQTTGAIFALKNYGWTDKQEAIEKDDLSQAVNKLIDKLPG